MNFKERLLQQSGLDESGYYPTVMKRGLYWHARLLKPVLEQVFPNHYAADLELIHDLAVIRRRKEFWDLLDHFQHHPHNVGAARKLFRIRLSGSRLKKLVYQVLPSSQD